MSKTPNLPSKLHQAYLNSSYHLFKPAFTIRIGEHHPLLDEFVIDNGAFSWAFISAYNPYSKPTSDTQNEQAHTEFCQYLSTQNYVFCEGHGIGDAAEWPAEKSVFILDISLDNAKTLGTELKQHAFVFGRVNQVAELVFC